MREDFWKDGICNLCNSIVEEGSSTDRIYDYMNRCTNSDCVEHRWHYTYDTEFLDYYKHKGTIESWRLK